MTAQDGFQKFLFHCIYEKRLSPKTIKAYSTDLNQFINFLGRTEIRADIILINKDVLKEYIGFISHKNRPKTIKRKIATLKAFFNYLEFEDYIEINPFRKIKLNIKEGRRLPKTLSLTTIKNLFKHVYDKWKHSHNNTSRYSMKCIIRDIAILELLFSTGVRVGELCNIDKEHIDLKRGSLRVIGKGNKERIIPICSVETLTAISSYYELFKPEIAQAGYLFVNRLKSRLSEQSVRIIIKKYSKSANITDNITPHMFRHSVATLLLENGVDIRHIQTFLGHSMITTTQIYVQVNEQAQRTVLTKKHPRRLI